MYKLLVLHLSDLHIRSENDLVLTRAEAIAAACAAANERPSRAVIVLTGDVAFSGKAPQYTAARRFIEAVATRLRARLDVECDVLVVPGNHDCDYAAEGNETRTAVLESIRRRKNSSNIADEILAACCRVQTEFEAFRLAVETIKPDKKSPIWALYELAIGDKKVLVHSVNTAWCSELENGLGAHEFPTEQHYERRNDKADARVLLMHHPYHWLNNARYREFEKLVRNSAEVVFTGHEHLPNAGHIVDTLAGHTTFYEGGVLQETPTTEGSSFLTCMIDLGERTTLARRFNWASGLYTERIDSRRLSAIPLPESVIRECPYTLEWQAYLRDVGAAISHHAKPDVTLADLYVFPEFTSNDENEEVATRLSGEKLLVDVCSSEVTALFKGEQSAGKTSWLKMAAQIIHERGLLPIFLRGSELSSSSEADLKKIIRAAIATQYGAAAVDTIEQKPREAKVLMVDGIDRFRFPDRYFNGVIDFFKRTHKSVLFTTQHMLSVRAAIEHEYFSSLQDFDQYEISEFGVRARYELTKRWFELAPLMARGDEGLRQRKIEETDRTITKLIGRGVVPAYPIYLLVLLQGVEAGQSGELENSALGEYYNYLITQSLLQKVKREDVKPIFDYCDHFAWFLHQSRKLVATEQEVLDFHSGFSKRMDVVVKFEATKKTLLDAKLWAEGDGGFGFRYPYARYFFLGRYLAREMVRDQEVFALIEEMATNLHVRDNGNIVTFLAHFSTDPRIIEMLVRSVESRFEGVTPLKLDTDVDPINQLVADAPRLAYNRTDAITRRHELVEQDQYTTERLETVGAPAPSAGPETPNELVSLLGELNAMFKAAEILGNVIKANATSMPGSEKQRLLGVLFNGGLRGVSSFLGAIAADTRALISEVQDLLDKRKPTSQERTESVAQKAVFLFIAWLIFWFIRRLSSGVGSIALQPAIDRYVAAAPTAANQLLGISSFLETPNPIPFDRLRTLSEEFEPLALATFILRHLAYTRLHMYETEVRERQQLLEELGIDIEVQRAVDYQTRNTKKVGSGRGRHGKSRRRR